MAYTSYTPTNWQNAPDHTTTPLSADNLNHMEGGIADSYKFDNTGTNLSSTNKEDAIKEVDAKTQHGIVELWTNPSPTSAYAGQTLNISQSDLDSRGLDVNINNIDAVDIEFAAGGSMSLSFIRGRIGETARAIYCGTDGSSLTLFRRDCAVSRANNTISLAFTDCSSLQIVPAGTNGTNNNQQIPVIITGLIHNN